MPLVSVIVPTHNRPQMLDEVLASVRAQTFTDYEIVVVSNGENSEKRDQSLASAMSYGARYFSLDEGNVSAARNFGVEMAAGAWIAFLDDDDLWMPEKLERQITEANRTGADMIVCDHVQFFPSGREIVKRLRLPKDCSYVKALSYQKWWGAPPSAVMVCRGAIDAVHGFDPQMQLGEDTDLWRRISWRHSIVQMDEVLMRYRIGHPSLMRPLIQAPRRRSWRLPKVLRDTPADLRREIPHPIRLFWRWLSQSYFPAWLRQPRKYLQRRPNQIWISRAPM